MKEQAHDFLRAAQAMADSMLTDMQARNPEMAAKIVQAVAQGEALAVACVFGTAPTIELASRSDYGTARRISSIQMELPNSHKMAN